MSEQVVETSQNAATATATQPVYLLYDPARRRRRGGGSRAKVGRKQVGPSALRYDPAIVAYEPRRRRTRRYDPVVGGGKALTDSLVDGLGFGLLMHAVPAIPEGNVSGLSYRDIGAGVVTLAYEKFYMRRGWSAALLGAIAGIATGKIVSSLGGWKP